MHQAEPSVPTPTIVSPDGIGLAVLEALALRGAWPVEYARAQAHVDACLAGLPRDRVEQLDEVYGDAEEVARWFHLWIGLELGRRLERQGAVSDLDVFDAIRAAGGSPGPLRRPAG
jgi:hypothetical protein